MIFLLCAAPSAWQICEAMRRTRPGVQRLEFCHDERQVVLRRGWRPIADGCIAEPGDTVFMECLGYIGYYSGLRTHDWPGLSSPQVVKAAKANGYQWAATLAEIKPSWVVLRPQEVVLHLGGDLSIPDCRYRLAKVFDATGRIEKLDLYGKGLLSFDSCFLVFHLEKEVAP